MYALQIIQNHKKKKKKIISHTNKEVYITVCTTYTMEQNILPENCKLVLLNMSINQQCRNIKIYTKIILLSTKSYSSIYYMMCSRNQKEHECINDVQKILWLKVLQKPSPLVGC